MGRPFSRFGLARDSDGGLGLRAKGEQGAEYELCCRKDLTPTKVFWGGRGAWDAGCSQRGLRGWIKIKGMTSIAMGGRSYKTGPLERDVACMLSRGRADGRTFAALHT